MHFSRLIAYFLAGAAFGLSLLAYGNYIYMLGFPDGHISELGRAQRQLAYFFIAISLFAGLNFLWLGLIASRLKTKRPLWLSSSLYALVLLSFFTIDYYYRLHLPGSGGG